MSHTTWLTSILKVCVCVCGREIHPFLLTRNRSFGRCNRLMNKSLKEGKCSSLGERFSSRFCHHLDSLTGEKGGLRGGRGIFLTDDYGSPKEHIILLCFERMWESRRGTSLSLNVVVENFPGDVFSLEFPCVLIVCLRGGSPNLVWKFVSDNCRIGGRYRVRRLPQSGGFVVEGKFGENQPIWIKIFWKQGKTSFLLEQTLCVSFGGRKMWARFFPLGNEESERSRRSHQRERERKREREGGKWNEIEKGNRKIGLSDRSQFTMSDVMLRERARDSMNGWRQHMWGTLLFSMVYCAETDAIINVE